MRKLILQPDLLNTGWRAEAELIAKNLQILRLEAKTEEIALKHIENIALQ